jgi:hypothetical protein
MVAIISAPPCVVKWVASPWRGSRPVRERGTLRVRGLAALAPSLNALHRSRFAYDRLPHPLACPGDFWRVRRATPDMQADPI